jgi:hypothetical protein
MDPSRFVSLAFRQVTLARETIQQLNALDVTGEALEQLDIANISLANAQDALNKSYALAREKELTLRN